MINLLPPTGKKAVLREYWMRVSAILLFWIASVLLIGAVALLPAYFYISFESNSVTKLQDDDVAYLEELKQIEVDIKKANAISALILETEEYPSTTDVLAVIDSLVTDDIMIDGITMQKRLGAIDSIEVRGMAVTREALVTFRDAAENQEYFGDVQLPVSNLARDRDIPFALKLTPSELLQKPL